MALILSGTLIVLICPRGRVQYRPRGSCRGCCRTRFLLVPRLCVGMHGTSASFQDEEEGRGFTLSGPLLPKGEPLMMPPRPAPHAPRPGGSPAPAPAAALRFQFRRSPRYVRRLQDPGAR